LETNHLNIESIYPLNQTKNKMNTYSNAKYAITTSFNQGSIHIRLTNNLSYAFYEGNFDAAAFRLPFLLKDVYELINKCFAAFIEPVSSGINATDKKYSIMEELDNSVLLLRFRCIMESILTVEFEVRMPEKIMSNDAQLTIHIQKQQQTIDLLSKRLEEMEKMVSRLAETEKIIACLGADITLIRYGTVAAHMQQQTFPISTKSLTISSPVFTQESYQKIKHFYQLNDLTLNSLDATNGPQSQITNSSAKKVTVNSCNSFGDFGFIKNFPNLEELVVSGIPVMSSLTTHLKSTKHKIKRITLSSYGATLNVSDLQNYCSQNGITLNI